MASCCTWDFTQSCAKCNLEDVLLWLKANTKKFSFQQEKGKTTGYEHFQGRFSLKQKHRKSELESMFDGDFHPMGGGLSPTSKENRTNTFYVTKEETRIAGPWSDTDQDNYIQKRLRECKLRKWQQSFIDTFSDREDRIINILVDTEGNKGKGFATAYCHSHNMGFKVPCINDSQQLLGLMCDKCYYTNCHDIKAVFIDMPRSMPKTKLTGIYSAIEQIKDGYLYDIRYKFREWWIEPPCIWVFTNEFPDASYLSSDRWRLWSIEDDELERIEKFD